ncbi:hypothetical protein [Vreelandella zhaodongensis]|uniref:hypothetical protein n=1 Tax=Vreelandella zhaodongensis TaxID=1176240 RepID=UPI003EC0024D
MSIQAMSTQAMSKEGVPALPIEQHLTSIQGALDDHNRLILVAQPGAGKTTRVPLTLLNSQWAKGRNCCCWSRDVWLRG